MAAVLRDLARGDSALGKALKIGEGSAAPEVHGWIVDTCIECDHQHFDAALKISLEEVLIALRDDAALLHDPSNVFGSDARHATGQENERRDAQTLYPNGFTARRFIYVIEGQFVWQGV